MMTASRFLITAMPLARPPAARRQEAGFALVMALVMLLIASLLAVSGMRTGNMQLLMAGNLQERLQALVDAENAIITAQNYIRDNFDRNDPYAPSASKGYYVYDPSTGVTGAESLIANPFSADWFDTEKAYSVTAASGDPKDDGYIIEFLGTRSAGGSFQNAATAATLPKRNLYRITARGARSRGAVELVQILHVTLKDPS
jgi:Tfp pilus assembly protein PilX